MSNCKELTTSVEEMLRDLQPLSRTYCIFRVPKRVRVQNEKAYTPQMVSIGPLHRANPDVTKVEERKRMYLKDFLGRTTIDLEQLVREIKQMEQTARNCYADSIDLSSDEFVKMVLVDGCFVIESFLKEYLDEEEVGFSSYLMVDLILLENQLPFFVLERLFNLALISNPRHKILHLPNSFLNLSVKQSWFLLFTGVTPDPISNYEPKHFVDLLRMMVIRSSSQKFVVGRYSRVQNATTLHEAGLTFKVNSSRCFLDLQYVDGVLEIPNFIMDDCKEILLRNLMILEVYLYSNDSCITDWVIFMDNLIDTPSDVDILIRKGVVKNYLGATSVVATIFNNLANETLLKSSNYYFSGLSTALNSYYEIPWHTRKATMTQNYFGTPIRVLSSIAAAILLFLTLVQTVCSLISVIQKK